MIAAAFAYFFGGREQETLIALISGGLVTWFGGHLRRFSSNEMFMSFICAFFVSTIAYSIAKAGFAQDYGKVIIGNIMLLVPELHLSIHCGI
jgi:uncharacterized membrane protein YjjP (DUF1212 family)